MTYITRTLFCTPSPRKAPKGRGEGEATCMLGSLHARNPAKIGAFYPFLDIPLFYGFLNHIMCRSGRKAGDKWSKSQHKCERTAPRTLRKECQTDYITQNLPTTTSMRMTLLFFEIICRPECFTTYAHLNGPPGVGCLRLRLYMQTGDEATTEVVCLSP